jgi:hypothetical protein
MMFLFVMQVLLAAAHKSSLHSMGGTIHWAPKQNYSLYSAENCFSVPEVKPEEALTALKTLSGRHRWQIRDFPKKV